MHPESPDLETIAQLSTVQISSILSNIELIRIIRSVDYPFAGKERLEFFDRDTLERVVCLIRRWSQQRLKAIRNAPWNLNPETPADEIPMIGNECFRENV